MKNIDCLTWRKFWTTFLSAACPRNLRPRLNAEKSKSPGCVRIQIIINFSWACQTSVTHRWFVQDWQVRPSGAAEKLAQLKLWVNQEGSLTLALPSLRSILAQQKIDLNACLPMILSLDVFKMETRNGADVLRFDLPRAGASLRAKNTFSCLGLLGRLQNFFILQHFGFAARICSIHWCTASIFEHLLAFFAGHR